jgi:hypothetical protein
MGPTSKELVGESANGQKWKTKLFFCFEQKPGAVNVQLLRAAEINVEYAITGMRLSRASSPTLQRVRVLWKATQVQFQSWSDLSVLG